MAGGMEKPPSSGNGQIAVRLDDRKLCLTIAKKVRQRWHKSQRYSGRKMIFAFSQKGLKTTSLSYGIQLTNGM